MFVGYAVLPIRYSVEILRNSVFLLHETGCSVLPWVWLGFKKGHFIFRIFLLQSQCSFKKLWQLYLNSFLTTCLMLICTVSDYTGCVILLDRDNKL